MIGTIEALGVFLLAVLPGFLMLRVFGYGRPPLRLRGPLGELGATVVASAAGWTVLYAWRGQALLPILLGGETYSVGDRLDAFAELAGISVVLGVLLGIVARVATVLARTLVVRWLGPPADAPEKMRKTGTRERLHAARLRLDRRLSREPGSLHRRRRGRRAERGKRSRGRAIL